MRKFACLFEELDRTTSTNDKVAALKKYFGSVPSEDAAWALFFLTGRRLKRFLSSGLLRKWAQEATGLPDWLIEESYHSVGDTAETIALLLDRADHIKTSDDFPLHRWMHERLLPLVGKTEEEQHSLVMSWWRALSTSETFILNKLMTGSFRVGVSQSLVVRALADLSNQETAEIAHRMMGDWRPEPEWFENLLAPGEQKASSSRPYPFFLASPLEEEPKDLGEPQDWQVEWKWDGIRAQLIRRDQKVFLWSRGEDLITERFPEIHDAALTLPDGCVLDGEILAFENNRPLLFGALQKRIGRKKLSKSILEAVPVVFMAYDLLEENGEDLRALPLSERRNRLENLLKNRSQVFKLSETIAFSNWSVLTALREQSRERAVEGFMLKRKSSPYQSGRRRGDWWKWKIDPYTVDAVLLYAQPGTGRRANLFTDYTFAVWKDDQLVPVAKAYSGLSDEEIGRLDNWIRRHTKERFGPVRSVDPVHVFELAFEAINESPRHKSGVALRFPRILRWRDDKPPKEANTLDDLKRLIDAET
jgi:DNA ligase 1